ncbi:acyl-CoA dehydrogenase family protein [Phreatobacter aquaticus]|uniref:Acyl-CoA dehydrogenase family protein n=1 Tax=Phreatobacter aquaticus TaxID=2570229 RepID=A0A4D7QHY5_9HYPH|nr:acyl-CoA dehydrogenase family protein [Phreatobacter aquaticus]QCK86321.1 acyl-CoA dehydrogenase family protein [Phreatobacter aquaticus]
MLAADFLALPFFDDAHRAFADRLGTWAEATVPGLVDHHDVDGSCRRLVTALGEAGFLKACVPGDQGGLRAALDVRTLCIARATLGYVDGLADFAFAMQGLGTGPISLFGTPAQKAAACPSVRDGKAISGFALSEPDAGSDVAALSTTATKVAGGWRLDGTKTWISNGGIADRYVVFARTGEAAGARGISAFIVPADTPGLSVIERIEVIAPHPLATLGFDNCVVPEDALLGRPGQGFAIAMATLDVFRSTVAAAALGMGNRALHEASRRAVSRKMFGAPLADLQLTQASLADSVAELEASALLIFRAAWEKDQGRERITKEAAIAKMVATENAQKVIDRAIQIFGGLGVKKGEKVEELYRDIRALRIYEGATEVQKIVIARAHLAKFQN